MIDIKVLKQLIKLMKDNDLSEIDLKDQDEQVSLKRGSTGQIVTTPAAPPPAVPAPAATSAEPPKAAEQKTPAEEGLLEIKSPMVGTFYSAPSPDADPFVSVGSIVGPDTVVCLIEAMKVFQEIKPEDVAGTIEKILVSSGEAVEHGQPLFLVRPK
ncbi:MAG: acetyl-CoA carboxylase biotin carboxyl carrier protein [Phycisphaeraceae bacterium]|nr:acetyl-CoA carboxylase biotin carboxyl carrier protein [Phycisphaeraceae bacterium]